MYVTRGENMLYQAINVIKIDVFYFTRSTAVYENNFAISGSEYEKRRKSSILHSDTFLFICLKI